MVGRQLPFFSLIVPFWLVAAQVGLARDAGGLARVPRRGRRASRIAQFVVSNFHGPWLVDIVARARLDARARGAAALLEAATATWRFDARDADGPAAADAPHPSRVTRSRLDGVAAVDVPLGFVFVWGITR